MIRIVHTRAEGTILYGSAKGDGVYEIVKPWFRWSRGVGIYIRNSRDKRADRWRIEQAVTALRAAGYEVAEPEIDDTAPGRSFAEAEQERYDRAEDRAERYDDRADRNSSAGHARWDRTRERMSHIPLGQPVLVGHHSERKHRRMLKWADNQDRKAIDELGKGRYWAGRAQAAERYRGHREDVPTTLRRIEKLEKQRRDIDKAVSGKRVWLAKTTEPPEGAKRIAEHARYGVLYQVPVSVDVRARLEADLAALDDELAYWREHVAQAEAAGTKIWRAEDFAKGDFARCGGTWYEVLRVNTKSLSLPWCHYGVHRKVVTREVAEQLAGQFGLATDRVPYDKITGKATWEELEEFLDGSDITEDRQN